MAAGPAAHVTPITSRGPGARTARRAGHSVAVLLRVYANCVDGQAAAANDRINDALDQPDSEAR